MSYVFHELLGQGGLGEVWGATHTPSNSAVAIKVLKSKSASLAHEVQAAASLNHPNVVRVLDFASASDKLGPVPKDGSYLVMEQVSGGTLRKLCGTSEWPVVRDALCQLLDALAYVHARGLVHRDVKPSNLLMTRTGQCKLADFGLAHAMEGLSSGLGGGTPRYMAPEQRSHSWRDHGPWTDLFAVGWTALALTRGRPDWGTPAQTSVPRGFDEWVRTLTAHDPARRFRRAADARYALGQLGYDMIEPDLLSVSTTMETQPSTQGDWWVTGVGMMHGHTAVPEMSTEAPSHTTLLDVPSLGTPLALPTLAIEVDTSSTHTHNRTPAPLPLPPVTVLPVPVRPPLPADWRPRTPRPFPSPMVGAGLGLVGLRSLPVVGREDQRDALWQALHLADRGGRVLRVLQGKAGFGKSTLASWLCTRADEVGAALVLRANHGPDGGPGHGLAAMLERHFRVEKLGAAATLARVRNGARALGLESEDSWQALAAWIALAPGRTESPGRRFAGPQERWQVLHRYLRTLATRRPVILWLDDLQWGPEAQQFAQHLLQSSLPAASLFVLATVQEEALAERPDAWQTIDSMVRAAPESADRIEVGVLPHADHAALLQGLLRLEDDLVAEVLSHTRGIPMNAVELVADWVQRGALVQTGQGFRLDADKAQLNTSMGEVWSRRLVRALQGQSAAARTALELAAMLGPFVDADEWEKACHAADLRPPMSAIDALERDRLIHVEPTSWRFVHGQLRQALQQSARDSHHFERLHLAAAESLVDQPGRYGGHMLAAGRASEAILPLLEGAAAHIERAEPIAAKPLLDAAAEALAAAPNAELHAIHALLGARNALRIGDYDTGLRNARTSWARASAVERGDLACSAAALGARCARLVGDIRQAELWLQRAEEAVGTQTDPWIVGLVHIASTVHHLRAGRLHHAEKHVNDAHIALLRAHQQRLPVPRWYRIPLVNAYENLAGIARARGDHTAMIRYVELCGEHHRRELYPYGEVTSLISLADAYRLAGKIDEATEANQRAWQRLEAMGSPFVLFPWMNLALIHTQREQDQQALVLLDGVLERSMHYRRANIAGLARLCRLVVYARRGQWQDWDSEVRLAIADIQQSHFVDNDVAQCAMQAAQLAPQERRGDLLRLAVSQWVALEQTDEAEAARALLQG